MITGQTMITGPCVTSEAVALGQSEARRVAAKVALSHDGGLVAFTQDEDHVTVRRLDASGQVQPGESLVPLTNAMDLYGVYHLASHYLVLTHGLCPGGRRLSRCLALRALGADGSPQGEEHLETTREEMTNPQLRVDGDSLVVLRDHLYIPSVLERYRVAADGGITRESLTELAFDPHRLPATPLGLAVDGPRWAALVREYDSQRDRSYLRLYRSDGAPSRVALPFRDSERVLDLAFVDDGLRVLLRTGSGRAQLARLGLDGQVLAGRLALNTDDELTGNRVVPWAESDRHGVRFSRRDLADRPIGEPLALAPGDQADVDGGGALFAVASVLVSRRQPSTVRLDTLHCQEL